MAIALSQIRVETELDSSKYVSGAKAQVDADAQMVQGAEKLAAAIEATDRRVGTSSTTYERLAKSLDPAYRAQQQLAAGLDVLQRVFDAGNSSVERHRELVELLQKRYADIASGLAPVKSAFDALRSSLDPAYVSQKQLEAGTATLNNALKAGIVDANTHVQLFQSLGRQYSQLGTQASATGAAIGSAATGLRAGSRAADDLTKSAFLNRQGLQELQASGVNAFQALSSGMSVWRVAQTEGAQVLGAFVQGGTISFAAIAGWGGILAGLAVTTALVGARFLEIGANIRSFNASLSTIASGSSASAEGLQSIVEHLRATGTAAADAKKAIDTVLQAGPSGVNTSAAAIGSLAELGRNIGAVRGTGITEVGSLTAAISGGADALIKYGLQLNALSAPEVAEIKNLAEHGKQADAVNLAVNRLSDVYSGKYEQSLSDAEKLTIRLKAAWDDLLDSLARSGAAEFAIEQIKGIADGIKTSADEIKRLIDLFKTLSSALPGGAQAATTSATRAQSDLADALRQRGVDAGAPFTDQQLGSILGGQSVALKPTPSTTGGGSLDSVIAALVKAESGGVQSRISSAGAIGLTQLLPGTAAGLGVNPYDPAQNLAGGTQYLLQQTQRFGSLEAGLQAYNWGPGNYQKYLQGYSQLPASVSAYSSGILRNSGATGQETALQLSASGGINYSAPTPAQTAAVDDYLKANRDLLAVQKEFTAKSVEVQANLDADRIIREKSLSGLEADAVRTDALATAKQKLANESAKASAVSQMEADGQQRITEAYGKSEAAGLRQVAVENARVAVLNTGADAQKVATDALVLQANQSVAAAQMQSRSLDQTVAASQRLAEASAHGTAALQEAQLQNQAVAATFDALNRAQAAYDQALTTGNDALVASTKATLDKANALTQQKDAQLKLIEASQETTQVNQNAEQLKNATEQLNLQIGLQGKTSEEIQGQVLLLQTKQELEGRFALASDEAKTHLVGQTEALVQTTIKLGEVRAAQQRLDEEVRSIADTVTNTLGTAIDDVLSGKKIKDWGALFKDMLRQIASTVIQSELVKPLIGSALQSAGFTQSAQQFGTIGQGGGLLSSLLGIGQAAGSASNIASATGLTSSSGGLFGGIGSGITSGVNSIGSSLFGLANPALQGPTLTGATLGESGILGGLSLSGIAGIAGIAGLAIPLVTSLFGNKKPSNNAGGLVLDLGSGGISGASGNQANLGVAQQIGSSLSTFEQQLLAKIPGATLPSGSVNIVKGDTTGITSEYSGPLGHIKASFGSTQEAVNAFSVAIAKDLGGVSDTLKQTLGRITDPSQIQAAIDVSAAYDKVKDSAAAAAAELSGAYDDIFKNVTADTVRSIGPFENVLNQINARFDQLTQSASQYGLSLDPINAGYAAAKDRLASDFNATIAQALKALQDPAQAAVDAEKKAGDQRVADATAVGADLVALEKFNAANLKQYTDAVAKQAADAAKAAADAAKAATDFAQSIGPSFQSIVASLSDQTGPFEKAFTAINDNIAKLTSTATAAGYATDDISKSADVARQGVTGAFNANISGLLQAITDPIQAAVEVEKVAGQARVREAQSVSGDLDAVSRYNAANLERVTSAAINSVNSVASAEQILRGAADALNASISSVTTTTKGPFAQALDALNASATNLAGALASASKSAADLAPLWSDLSRSLEKLRQSFNQNIQDLTLGLTDPFQAALNIELAAGKKRVADAMAVQGDLTAVDEYNRRNLLAVAKAAASVTDALATAAGFNRDINQQILEITDPIQAALNAELAAGAARVAAAQQVGADLAKVDELNRLKLIAVGDAAIKSANATADATIKSANAVSDAAASSADALDKFTGRLQSLEGALNQLTSGPLSGLTPAQQVGSSTANFQTLLAQVKGGNRDLIPDLTAAGTSAVQASQAAYGNSQKTADLRASITASLEDVAAQTGQEALAAAASVQLTAANQAQVSAAEKAQVASATRIAGYAAAQSSAEQSRTGVVNELLRDQATASQQIAAQLSSQAAAQTQISAVEAARSQVAAEILQQETAAAASAAEAAKAAADTAAAAKVTAALVQQQAAAAARAAGVTPASVGTPDQQAAYQAAAQQQAASVAARVVPQPSDPTATAQADFFATQAQQARWRALLTGAAAPSSAAYTGPSFTPDLSPTLPNLSSQYWALPSHVRDTYNTVVSGNPGGFNNEGGLQNEVTLVSFLTGLIGLSQAGRNSIQAVQTGPAAAYYALTPEGVGNLVALVRLRSEYEMLSPALQAQYVAITSANYGYYSADPIGVQRQRDVITQLKLQADIDSLKADQQNRQEAAAAITQFIYGNAEIGKMLAQLVRVGTIVPNSESQSYLDRNFYQYARDFVQSFSAKYPNYSLSDLLAAQGFASGTLNTPAGWIRVGERGPELIHQGGGNIVLPNGVLPTGANDNSAITELRAMREELAALRRQMQGGQALASRDAKAIVGETANVGRAIARSPATRRVVA